MASLQRGEVKFLAQLARGGRGERERGHRGRVGRPGRKGKERTPKDKGGQMARTKCHIMEQYDERKWS